MVNPAGKLQAFAPFRRQFLSSILFFVARIEPDVKGEMIVLMAIEQDFGRGNRSPGDSFCQTFMEIASNQRQVKCDK